MASSSVMLLRHAALSIVIPEWWSVVHKRAFASFLKNWIFECFMGQDGLKSKVLGWYLKFQKEVATDIHKANVFGTLEALAHYCTFCLERKTHGLPTSKNLSEPGHECAKANFHQIPQCCDDTQKDTQQMSPMQCTSPKYTVPTKFSILQGMEFVLFSNSINIVSSRCHKSAKLVKLLNQSDMHESKKTRCLFYESCFCFRFSVKHSVELRERREWHTEKIWREIAAQIIPI